MRYSGRARDVLTPPDCGSPRILREASFEAIVEPGFTIRSIASQPPHEGLLQLAGKSAAAGYRRALAEALPEERDPAGLLRLALDDIPGANIVSGVAWSEWDPDWTSKLFGNVPIEKLLKAREDVCIGHAAGSSAQDPEHPRDDSPGAAAAALVRSDDPEGWHAMEPQTGVGFRRVRRIDVSAGPCIVIDAEFQDSYARPGGGRNAVHEYGLVLTAEPETLAILAIKADPRVLPYAECPSVSASLPRLLGTRLADLRKTVPVAMAGAAGCTHLNDAFRALADVPWLLHHMVRP